MPDDDTANAQDFNPKDIAPRERMATELAKLPDAPVPGSPILLAKYNLEELARGEDTLPAGGGLYFLGKHKNEPELEIICLDEGRTLCFTTLLTQLNLWEAFAQADTIWIYQEQNQWMQENILRAIALWHKQRDPL